MAGDAAAAAAASKTFQCRSVYVGQLRRAFLLRVHPDRFRRRSAAIRSAQSELLKALGERMSAPDFVEYTRNKPAMHHNQVPASWKNRTSKSSYDFVLERRDGSLLKHNIQLDDPVNDVLQSMADALRRSGAASLPSPPSPPLPDSVDSDLFSKNGTESNKWNPSKRNIKWASASDPYARESNGVDGQFDVNTRAGRDLERFLNILSREEVEERRSMRMDVTTTALVARRLYSFQSIDGTGLKWSSSSFSKLLRSFISLHDEHHSRFHVEAFYPLRLVFSLDEFQDPLDLYGGILYLNPTQTHIQMLQVLLEVTPTKLDDLARNRAQLQLYSDLVQSRLGIRLKKGHSCSSFEYHRFLDRMHNDLVQAEQSGAITSFISSSLSNEAVGVTIESSLAVRRGRVSSDGDIYMHAGMSLADVSDNLNRLSLAALERREEESDLKQSIRDVIKNIQWSLGLQKVYKTNVVQNREFLDCLLRLQDAASTKEGLSGLALGVAGRGTFCNLGDDGSIVVPVDWQ